MIFLQVRMYLIVMMVRSVKKFHRTAEAIRPRRDHDRTGAAEIVATAEDGGRGHRFAVHPGSGKHHGRGRRRGVRVLGSKFSFRVPVGIVYRG